MWFILLLLAITAFVRLVQHQYNYWERRSIPHEKPSIPFGSLNAVRRKERSFGLALYDIYMRSKEQVVGIHLFFKPAILVRDAKLVRTMLTSDFGHFHDRGVYVDEKNNPMSANLFSMEAQSWRASRTKLGPAFTSGKLKGMFGAVNDIGDKMVAYLNDLLKSGAYQTLEMQDIIRTYAVDIIGSVIFGLDINSYANPNNEFRTINKSFDRSTFLGTIYSISAFMCPVIVKLMIRLGYQDIRLISLRDIVKRTIEHREENQIVRKDLLQLLIQLRNTGKISDDYDKNWNIETAANGVKSMSIETITAQSFLFYVAGSETTAATAAFTLYELAMYPELMRKAQNDVAVCLQKHNLKPTDPLTYDAVQDMKFLDLCIMETTRKYPGLPVLNRICTKDYQIPDTNYTIAKGTPIIISLLGLHRDPEYFPNPMDYEPERFLEENHNYIAMAFMPFGEGPRICIAQRMGRINAKVALAKLLSNFNIETMERKEVEFEYNPAPVLIPKNGLNVRLSKKSIE